MRVFVTGASGFVGSAVVSELLQAGHGVTGLARTTAAAEKISAAGADVFLGSINDPDNLIKGIDSCDAVIHTAFNHDFTNYRASCEADRRIILALGDAYMNSSRPVVITSGIGLLHAGNGLVEEGHRPPSSAVVPRAASEEAAQTAAQQGGNMYVVRLSPTVHDSGDHGFIPMLISMAREKEVSAYIEDGKNRWPAVHRRDAAMLYRLIIEQQPAQRVFHAVTEEGIPFRQIAAAIGTGLNLPVISKSKKEAADHFDWFFHFAAMDCAASSKETQQILNWVPSGNSLMEDLSAAGYFH